MPSFECILIKKGVYFLLTSATGVPANPNITGMNPHIHVHKSVSTKKRSKYLSDICFLLFFI